MPDHTCGPPYPPKHDGCCLCCAEDVHEVRARHPDDGGPFARMPLRLGPQLEHATQVRILMSDGAELDLLMCLDCAAEVKPAHLHAIWQACIDRNDLSLIHTMHCTPSVRAGHLRSMLAIFPVAVIGTRREADVPGGVMVDRRA